MSKFKLKSTWVLCLFAFLLFGCEMDQEVDIPIHEPKLTLRLSLINVAPESHLYRHDIFTQLFIGQSQGVLEPEEELRGVKNATVALFDESGEVVEEYVHTGKLYYYGYETEFQGYYTSINGFVPEPGKTYTIRASAPGFEPVEAVTTMPATTTFKSSSFRGGEVSDSHNNTHTYLEGTLQVTFEDKRNEANYYRIWTFAVDSVYARVGSAAYVIEDSSDDIFETNEKLRIGNVFSDELYTAGEITLSNKIIMYNWEADPETGKLRKAKYIEVVVQQLSRDEYLFHKSRSSQSMNRDNPFAEYVNVHSNLKNGFGVLGGVTVSKSYIPIEE